MINIITCPVASIEMYVARILSEGGESGSDQTQSSPETLGNWTVYVSVAISVGKGTTQSCLKSY